MDLSSPQWTLRWGNVIRLDLQLNRRPVLQSISLVSYSNKDNNSASVFQRLHSEFPWCIHELAVFWKRLLRSITSQKQKARSSKLISSSNTIRYDHFLLDCILSFPTTFPATWRPTMVAPRRARRRVKSERQGLSGVTTYRAWPYEMSKFRRHAFSFMANICTGEVLVPTEGACSFQ